MNWDKSGHIISGIYEGVAYAGRVTNSSARTNGEICHTIDLFEPIYVGGERLNKITVSDLFPTHLKNVSMGA